MTWRRRPLRHWIGFPWADQHSWLVGLVLVTIASWGRWLATGSLKVDQNYPAEPAASLLFALVLVGFSLLVLGWWGILKRPIANPRRLAFGGLFVSAFMLPLLSNDVFSLFGYASLAARGADVFTNTSALGETAWYGWIGEHWSHAVCVYGPTTLFGIMPVAWAGQNPWLALVLLRFIWFIPTALVMELTFRRMQDRPQFHAMVWLNPLFVVEGAGQLHADILGLIAITLGIAAQMGGRVRTGWICWGLATLSKYSFGLGGAFFWLSGARSAKALVRRAGAMVVLLVGMGAVAFAPFYRGLASLTEPIRALGDKNPGGSITEIAGYLVNLARGGQVAPADMPVRLALEYNRAHMGTTWFVTSLVLRLATLGIAIRVLAVLLRKLHEREAIALGTGVLIVAATTLASHRFQSWYLLSPLPFFGLLCTKAWRKWWVPAVFLSVSTEFIHILPRTSVVLPVWSAATNGALIVLFLSSMRSRFWDFEELTLDRQASRGPSEGPPPLSTRS